ERTPDARSPLPGRAHPRATPDRSRRLTTMRISSKKIEQQLASVFRSWGMSDAHADTTAAVMVETDLRGVDSHGISMLPTYDNEFRNGRLNMRPVFRPARIWYPRARESVAPATSDVRGLRRSPHRRRLSWPRPQPLTQPR